MKPRNKDINFAQKNIKHIGPKTYWFVLKFCPNNKKYHCIPPVFYENRFVTDFKENYDLFNSFVRKQCSVINNGSEMSSVLYVRTDKALSNITFN